MPTAEAGPAPWYAARAASHARAVAALEARHECVVPFRVGAALASATLFLLTDPLAGAAAWAAAAGGFACAAAFAALVATQRRIRREALREGTLAALAREGQARVAREWNALARAPETTEEPESPAGHPYARDLALFGRASLFRLCGPITTPMGRERLAGWLLAPAPAAVSGARREAVRALAAHPEWRMELAARGRARVPGSAGALTRLLVWAEAPGSLAGTWAWIPAHVLPPLTIGLGALHFVGVTGALWLAPLLLQLLVLRRIRKRVADESSAVSSAAPALLRYAAQLGWLASVPGAAVVVEAARAAAGGGSGAAEALRKLARLLDFADSRANLAYGPLNALLLLDVHLQRALEAWKARHGTRVRAWLDALGEVEALSGLATLAHDEPRWVFPEEGATANGQGTRTVPLRARALGHPLLSDGVRVANDVEIPAAGAFLLVTGSNMSGKSTLLRAIGGNVVLARAGGPVCAESMSLEEVRLHTSMAVEDSLELGVSRFMAELLRMKEIVEAARASPDAPPVLYLLDEILQGTNTWERRAGARAVLRHLLDAGAVGAVTTHDLTLHQAPDLEARTRAFHFRESVTPGEHGAALSFDYRLRPGLSTTRNAMVLLEAVGLGPLPGQARE